MASKARAAFKANAEDIERLLEIHTDLGGQGPGRRRRLEVLNKSAIVLVTSIWEAYCEDIVAEGLEHVVSHAPDATALPKALKKLVLAELKDDKHELALWDLADGGWRGVLQKRLKRLQDERNRKLNTPKTGNIEELFEKGLGITQISASWTWNGMSRTQASKKLDDYVSLRGQIAHRGSGIGSVRKSQVSDYYEHVTRLVGKTGGRVNSTVKKSTGSGLW